MRFLLWLGLTIYISAVSRDHKGRAAVAQDDR